MTFLGRWVGNHNNNNNNNNNKKKKKLIISAWHTLPLVHLCPVNCCSITHFFGANAHQGSRLCRWSRCPGEMTLHHSTLNPIEKERFYCYLKILEGRRIRVEKKFGKFWEARVVWKIDDATLATAFYSGLFHSIVIGLDNTVACHAIAVSCTYIYIYTHICIHVYKYIYIYYVYF